MAFYSEHGRAGRRAYDVHRAYARVHHPSPPLRVTIVRKPISSPPTNPSHCPFNSYLPSTTIPSQVTCLK